VANSEKVSGREDAGATGWQVAESKKTKVSAKRASGTPSGSVAGGTVEPAHPVPHDVGTALRNAFRATVDEEIPIEMLDLLRRLD